MSRSTARTLDVFEVFARERRPLNLSELSKEIGIAPSSCFSIVKTLRERGFIYELGGRRGLYPTRRMLENASAIALHEPHMMWLAPFMEQLRDLTEETVILGRQQSESVVYLHVVEGPRNIRYSAKVGDIKPLHSSAIGKVILAAMEREECTRLIERLTLRKVTNSTITRAAELVANLDAGLARGYQVTIGENVSDVAAIAMPVTIGRDTYGLCIAGPKHRMETQHQEHARSMEEILAKVQAADFQ